jgi:SAM-dependent methyltransferase
MIAQLRSWLAHPLTKGLDLDDPQTTALRKRIVATKPFLYDIYVEWYAMIRSAIPDGSLPILELGSGPGFLANHVDRVITSDVFRCPDIQAVLDGQALPFRDQSLRAIVMTNVLHHIPNLRRFLHEAERCLCNGGVIVLIEPWVTDWSRIVYRYLHHEPFDPEAIEWSLPNGGPLSEANGALPWMAFMRDRQQFDREFSSLHVASIRPIMPFRYLVSGGIAMRDLAPAWSIPLWKLFEQGLQPVGDRLAMFAMVTVCCEHDRRS